MDLFCHLLAMFVVKKNDFKISQQKISLLIFTGTLQFKLPRTAFFMRLGIFYLRLLDKNIPALLKVQASEIGLEVPKYPQEAQNTAKKQPTTLVLQNCSNPEKNGFV